MVLVMDFVKMKSSLRLVEDIDGISIKRDLQWLLMYCSNQQFQEISSLHRVSYRIFCWRGEIWCALAREFLKSYPLFKSIIIIPFSW